MSVLIRGMGMPEDGCHHIICIYSDGEVATGGKSYKAVEVPPHGRLIDADAVLEAEGRYIISFGKEGIDVAEILRMPTVIEAEV